MNNSREMDEPPVDRIIHHPIFLKCCHCTNDKFWKNIFDELAYGICPYGIYFNRGMICCKGNKGNFNYIIDDTDDIEIIYENIRDILTETGVISPDEKIIKQRIFTDFNNPGNEQTWNEIKKKNKKDLLVELFAIDLMTVSGITIEQARYVESFIRSALMFKTISSSDIIIKNGRISSIEGITIENKNIKFDIDLYDFNIDCKDENTHVNIKKMSDYWESYLDNLECKK